MPQVWTRRPARPRAAGVTWSDAAAFLAVIALISLLVIVGGFIGALARTVTIP